ncbi:hypothetical protein [Aliagarivorans marinus]|uniref:hypothetical protein n=1 Tax=Aliagarivorans marinus TaxID=561965 RepID=UPI0004796696|nr:hypothetical protein [Aliagarivorans marinus]
MSDAIIKTDANGLERRRFYRVEYPAALIHSMVKMINARMRTSIGQANFEKEGGLRWLHLMPALHVNHYCFPVLDVSEGGLRTQWRTQDDAFLTRGDVMHGTLVFNPDLAKYLEHFPRDVILDGKSLIEVAAAGTQRVQVCARVNRVVHSHRSPYPIFSFQFHKDNQLDQRLIRQQESMLIQMFREKYLERMRERRQLLLESAQF